MIYRFQQFELDTERQDLRKNRERIALPPKAFSVLLFLIERSTRLVSKGELLDEFWPANVGDAPLLTTVSLIRKALNDDRSTQSIIKTYHGRGFRFVASLDVPSTEKLTPNQNEESKTNILLQEQRLVSVLSVRLFDQKFQNAHNDQNRQAIEDGHRAAREIVETHQGSLLHMMANGFTAIFGLKEIYEDCARRATYCAEELSRIPEVKALNSFGLVPSFSVETGQLQLTKEGGDQNWEPPGSIERDALVLSQTAHPGEILLSFGTLAHLGDEVSIEVAPGGARLISVLEQRAGIPSKRQAPRSKFVGRVAEMAFLTACIDGLKAGRGHAAMISGTPGVGKSRLVAEFVQRADIKDSSYLILNCLPSLRNTPLAPIRAMCSSLFADLPTGTIENEIDEAIFRNLMDETVNNEPLLSGLSEFQRKQRSQNFVIQHLYAITKQAPLVLVFEDVHWIDASSREFLEAIAQSVDQARLIVVMTTRPVEQPPFIETVIQMSPLARNDSMELLRTIPEIKDLDEIRLDALVQRAGGNPFFLEELALATHSGVDPSLDLPKTVHAVISGRIAELDERLRSLLFIVAVIGSPAPADTTAMILGLEDEQVNLAADQLVGMGFLRRDETGFSFRHMLISDTAYSLVTPENRKRLHLEIATGLEREMKANPARPEVLAWHYQNAEVYEQAILNWISACRIALRNSALKEAAAFAENGIVLVEKWMPDAAALELELQLCLALSLTSLKGFAANDMGAAYLRAHELNRSVRSAKAGFQIGSGLSIHHWVLGNLSKSLDHAKELLELAKLSENQSWKIQAHASVGEVYVHMGSLANGLKHLTAGVDIIASSSPDSIPAQNAAIACASYAGWAASLSGNSDKAMHFLKTSKRLCEVFENPFAEATHFALSPGTYMYEMDAENCLNSANRAIEISRKHGFPFWHSSGLIYRGWCLSQAGRFSEALKETDDGIAIFEATGAGVQLANWYGLKAEILLAAGKFKVGLDAAKIALKHAERTKDMYYIPRVYAVFERLYGQMGESEKARLCASKGQKMSRRFGMKAQMTCLSSNF